jgi:hypothetical protein
MSHILLCVCVGVMYSGEYDVCSVTLSVIHTGQAKKFGFDSHRGQANFSACRVWMYTQSNITNIIYCICIQLRPNQERLRKM